MVLGSYFALFIFILLFVFYKGGIDVSIDRSILKNKIGEKPNAL